MKKMKNPKDTYARPRMTCNARADIAKMSFYELIAGTFESLERAARVESPMMRNYDLTLADAYAKVIAERIGWFEDDRERYAEEEAGAKKSRRHKDKDAVSPADKKHRPKAKKKAARKKI